MADFSIANLNLENAMKLHNTHTHEKKESREKNERRYDCSASLCNVPYNKVSRPTYAMFAGWTAPGELFIHYENDGLTWILD